MGRFTASRTHLKGDPRFDSILASKFINCLMWDGKKTTAQRVFYDALELIGKKISDTEPIEVFKQAIENIKPQIEVRSKRVGGAAYQVPMQVNRARQQSLAIRWLLLAVRDKKGRAITQPVQARYEIFEAESRADVRIRVTVRDLGPKKAVLFDASPSANERDKRGYIKFSGDERALGGLASVGTDQTPPKSPERLARQALMKIADQLAKATLTQLEKAPR